MPTRSKRLVIFAVMSLGIIAAAHAQPVPFDLSIPKQRAQISPGGFVQFDIVITNTTNAPLRCTIVRTLNEIPDSSWTATICYETQCFADTTNFPDPFILQPGASRSLDIAYNVGSAGSGRSVLRFSAGGGSSVVEKEFAVDAVPASIAVPGDAADRSVAVHPNPTRGMTTVILPPTADDGVTISLYDVMGRLLADLSTVARGGGSQGARHVQVDLSGFQSGAYMLRVALGRVTAVSTVIVSH